MNLIRYSIQGIVGVFNFTSSPLYRYPYRNSAEGMQGDWRRIGKDIEAALEQRDERRRSE